MPLQKVVVATPELGDVTSLVLPPPAAAVGDPYWLWLLHGRGGTAEEMEPLIDVVRAAVTNGALPPYVVVAPDAPWCDRVHWWVDSTYDSGRPVESGVLGPVREALERRLSPPDRAHRIIGGVSMGGAAALRWAIVHRPVFGSALLLSPAVYEQGPPPDSSALTSGAFGSGPRLFDADRYAEIMDYRCLLRRRPVEGAATRVALIVGDGEPAHSAADLRYDLDLEAARLHATLKRRPDFESSLRVVGGGHQEAVWAGATVDGLRRLQPRSGGLGR